MEVVLSYELLNNTLQTWLRFIVVTSAALAGAYLFKMKHYVLRESSTPRWSQPC